MYMFGGLNRTQNQAEQYTRDILSTEQVIADLTDPGKIADFQVTDNVFADYNEVVRVLSAMEWDDLPLSGKRFLLHRLVLKTKGLADLNEGTQLTVASHKITIRRSQQDEDYQEIRRRMRFSVYSRFWNPSTNICVTFWIDDLKLS